MRDSALLLILALRHYGYQHAPAWAWGDLFSIAGSVAIIACLIWLKPWLPLALWAIAEEALVVTCSVSWLLSPIDMAGQSEQCSAQMGAKIGAIGLAWLAYITLRATLSTFTGTQKAKGAENE